MSQTDGVRGLEGRRGTRSVVLVDRPSVSTPGVAGPLPTPLPRSAPRSSAVSAVAPQVLVLAAGLPQERPWEYSAEPGVAGVTGGQPGVTSPCSCEDDTLCRGVGAANASFAFSALMACRRARSCWRLKSAVAVGVPAPGVTGAAPCDGPGNGRSSVGFRGAEDARDWESSSGDGPPACANASSVGDGRLTTGATSKSTGKASQRLRLRSRLTGAAAAEAAIADGTRARALLRGAGPA